MEVGWATEVLEVDRHRPPMSRQALLLPDRKGNPSSYQLLVYGASCGGSAGHGNLYMWWKCLVQPPCTLTRAL